MSENQHIIISAVTTEEIPARHRPSTNSKYHLVFNPAIAEPEKWISFPASFVAGRTTTRKQITIHEAATSRRIKVKTRIRGDVMYVRYVGPAQPKITTPAKDNCHSAITDARIGLAPDVNDPTNATE
jgi:hypothetical protein